MRDGKVERTQIFPISYFLPYMYHGREKGIGWRKKAKKEEREREGEDTQRGE